MKKTILILVAFLCASTFFLSSLQAQDELHDPKAKAILDKLSEKAKTYQTIGATFSFTLESSQSGTNETKDGEFLKKDNKYKLSIPDNDIYFDGKSKYSHMHENQECQIDDPEPEAENVFDPNYIFNFYKKGFKYKLIGEKVEDGKTLQEIDLFPEDPKKKQFSRIKLKVDKSTSHIHSVKYFGDDGNNYTILIKKFTPNAPASDKDFFFDCKAHPEVECIDLRGSE